MAEKCVSLESAALSPLGQNTDRHIHLSLDASTSVCYNCQGVDNMVSMQTLGLWKQSRWVVCQDEYCPCYRH